MLDTNLSFDQESLFQQVIARGREQGVTEQAAYNDLVEEVVEERREAGEMSVDDPTEDLQAQLRGRWSDYLSLFEEGEG